MSFTDQSRRLTSFSNSSLIVELNVHAVVDLIVGQGNVILEDCVPLLEDDLVIAGAGLRGNQLFKVSYGVVWAVEVQSRNLRISC